MVVIIMIQSASLMITNEGWWDERRKQWENREKKEEGREKVERVKMTVEGTDSAKNTRDERKK